MWRGELAATKAGKFRRAGEDVAAGLSRHFGFPVGGVARARWRGELAATKADKFRRIGEDVAAGLSRHFGFPVGPVTRPGGGANRPLWAEWRAKLAFTWRDKPAATPPVTR